MWQFRVRRWIEQRSLALAIHAFALLYLPDDRFDAWRFSLDGLLLAGLDRDLALIPGAPAGQIVRQFLHAGVYIVSDHQRLLAGKVHHHEPGQAGEQGNAGQEQGQQEQGCTDLAEQVYQPETDDTAKYATGTGRQCARNGTGLECHQPAAGTHREQKTGPAN